MGKNAYDLRHFLTNGNRISGVKKLCNVFSDSGVGISDENRETAERIVNYFGIVKEFLAYAGSDERGTVLCVTDAEINNRLLLMKEKTGKYFNVQLF